MARKKKPEEHANHERWMVSYADFITLLFAFFVVMYSISVVNQGKYKVLSESLVAAFKDPKKSLEPIQVGEIVRAPADLPDLGSNPQPIMSRPINPRNLPEIDQLSSEDLIDVSEQLYRGGVQIKYEIQTDGGLEMGGWTIDDFCIVAFVEPEPEVSEEESGTGDGAGTDAEGGASGEEKGGCSSTGGNANLWLLLLLVGAMSLRKRTLSLH